MAMRSLAVAVFAAALWGGASLQAQTASELLQKGIYLQETMGDLDGAIKIYRQVARMAQGSRANAAQAQFRLAACLEKKGQRAEAARLLQKLIEEYPEQTDLVAKAKALLPSGAKLLPAPWVDGEILDLSATMENAPPAAAMKMRYSAQSSKTHSGHWTFEYRLYNVMSSYAFQVETDRETLKPVVARNRGINQMFPDSRVSYQDAEARVEVKGKDPKTLKLDGLVFDSNEIVWVIRRLPLTMGYKTSFQVLPAPAMAAAKMEVSVIAEEDVKTPAGAFHAYRVEAGPGQTYWISTDPSRYLVKSEQGSMLTAVLSAIRRADRPSVYRDDKLGFSLSLPAGWTAEETPSLVVEGKPVVLLLAPDSSALVTLTVEPGKSDTPPTLAGMRAEAEKRFSQRQFLVQKLRGESWQTRQVGGHPALSWMADATDMFARKNAMILYTTWVRSDSLKAEFSAQVDAEDFDALRPRLDQIVNTFTLR